MSKNNMNLQNFNNENQKNLRYLEDGEGTKPRSFWQAKAYCNALVTKIEGKWPFQRTVKDKFAFHVCMEGQGFHTAYDD